MNAYKVKQEQHKRYEARAKAVLSGERSSPKAEKSRYSSSPNLRFPSVVSFA